MRQRAGASMDRWQSLPRAPRSSGPASTRVAAHRRGPKADPAGGSLSPPSHRLPAACSTATPSCASRWAAARPRPGALPVVIAAPPADAAAAILSLPVPICSCLASPTLSIMLDNESRYKLQVIYASLNSVLRQLHYYWRVLRRDTLPLSVRHLHPYVSVVRVVVNRLARRIGTVAFELAGRNGRIPKYRHLLV